MLCPILHSKFKIFQNFGFWCPLLTFSLTSPTNKLHMRDTAKLSVANYEEFLLKSPHVFWAQSKHLSKGFNIARKKGHGVTQFSRISMKKGQKSLFPFFQFVTQSRHFFTLLSKNFWISKSVTNRKFGYPWFVIACKISLTFVNRSKSYERLNLCTKTPLLLAFI